eukprot:227439_1
MNESVMKFQTRKLTRLLPEYNHIMINAPYIATEDPPTQILKHFKPPFYEHCHFEWINENKVKYFGVDETIETYKETLKNQNIDGIVAFSQGTYISSLLSNEIPLKFFVSVCGMPFLDDKYRYQMKFDMPSFHIVGKNDEWYQRGIEFHTLYKDDAPLYEHKAGHNFPAENQIYQELVSWIKAI